MRKALILMIVLAVALCAAPAFAVNIEMLDEMTLGAKVSAPSIILTSDHIDIGAEIGTKDLTNSDTIKGSFYAMGVVTIKGWSIFNFTSK